MPIGTPQRAKRRNVFYDEFNGTTLRAEWAKTDTESKLSVSGGNLVCSGGKATPAWDDPRITWTKPIAAKAGVTFECEITFSAFGATGMDFGFDPQTPVTDALRPGFDITSAGVLRIVEAAGGVGLTNTPITLSTGVSYRFRITLLGTQGIAWLYSADGGATWKIVWIDTVAASGSLFAGYSNNSATFTSAYVRVFKGPVIVPILSDTFASRTAPGRADTGQPWINRSTLVSPTFASNDVRIPAGQIQIGLVAPVGISDGIWEGDLNFGSAPSTQKVAYIIPRYRDTANYIRAEFSRTAQNIVIQKVIGSSATILATLSSAGFADNTTYRMRVVAVGNSISVYQDGVFKISTAESVFQYAAFFSLYLNDNLATPDIRWDNVQVWGIPRRPILMDTFDKPDGTYLSPAPDVGGPYTMSTDIGMPAGAIVSEVIASGRGSLANNPALSSANYLYGLVAMPSAAFFASILVRWNSLSGNLGAQGIMLRRQDDQNYLAIYLNSINNTMVVRKRLAGTFTTIASGSFTPTVNTDTLIVALFVGNTLEVYLNGVRLISTSYSDFQTPGTAGPFQGIFGGGPMLLDDLRIYALASPIAIHDTFTRADSATTMGSTETPGSAWAPVNSTVWGISSNKAYDVSDGSADITLVTHGLTDYSVESDVSGTVQDQTNFRLATLVVAYQDANNYFFVDEFAGLLRFTTLVAGVSQTVASYAAGMLDGVTYTIRAELIGSVVNLYSNGTKRLTYSLSTTEQAVKSASRQVGLRLRKGGTPATAARWDNFAVKEIV